jgi:hypothetical protein
LDNMKSIADNLPENFSFWFDRRGVNWEILKLILDVGKNLNFNKWEIILVVKNKNIDCY